MDRYKPRRPFTVDPREIIDEHWEKHFHGAFCPVCGSGDSDWEDVECPTCGGEHQVWACVTCGTKSPEPFEAPSSTFVRNVVPFSEWTDRMSDKEFVNRLFTFGMEDAGFFEGR